MSGPPVQLDENAVRKILARAVEIENQQRGALTETQVRAIARDLSIPDHVIEQALAEYRTAAKPDAVRAQRSPLWLKLLAVSGLLMIVLMAIVFISRAVVPPP